MTVLESDGSSQMAVMALFWSTILGPLLPDMFDCWLDGTLCSMLFRVPGLRFSSLPGGLA